MGCASSQGGAGSSEWTPQVGTELAADIRQHVANKLRADTALCTSLRYVWDATKAKAKKDDGSAAGVKKLCDAVVADGAVYPQGPGFLPTEAIKVSWAIFTSQLTNELAAQFGPRVQGLPKQMNKMDRSAVVSSTMGLLGPLFAQEELIVLMATPTTTDGGSGSSLEKAASVAVAPASSSREIVAGSAAPPQAAAAAGSSSSSSAAAPTVVPPLKTTTTKEEPKTPVKQTVGSGAAAAAGSPASAEDTTIHRYALPAGTWLPRQGGFYYNSEEALYFFPAAGHYFDPAANSWYIPEQGKWVDDDGHQEILEEMKKQGKY